MAGAAPASGRACTSRAPASPRVSPKGRPAPSPDKGISSPLAGKEAAARRHRSPLTGPRQSRGLTGAATTPQQAGAAARSLLAGAEQLPLPPGTSDGLGGAPLPAGQHIPLGDQRPREGTNLRAQTPAAAARAPRTPGTGEGTPRAAPLSRWRRLSPPRTSGVRTASNYNSQNPLRRSGGGERVGSWSGGGGGALRHIMGELGGAVQSFPLT